MGNVWGLLRDLAHAVVVWSRPHTALVAATDGRRIWIDPTLTAAETRCVLAHEAIHIKHGHTGCQTPAVERQVRLEVAQFMISFEDLQRVAGWSKNLTIMAEELDVLEQVLIDRLQTLDGDQMQQLWPPNEHIA